MLNLPGSAVTRFLLADWAEVYLLFGPKGRTLSVAALLDLLVEEGSVADVEVYDAGLEDDLTDESESQMRAELRRGAAEGLDTESALAEETIDELQRRADQVGPSFPIVTDAAGSRLRVGDWREALVYAFMVALNARYLWRLDANLNLAARLFERMTVPALRRYWGGEAEHFGWPRTEDEEPGFRAALPALAGRMRERLNVAPEELGSGHKDLAVDAVAWRPLDDRTGQTVMLCQCGVGDDWRDKGVPLAKWTTLVNFSVRPTRGLAFPFIPDAVTPVTEVDWLLLCAGVGVPFDRLRLAQLLGDAEVPEALLEDIRGWVEAFEPALAEVVSEGAP